MRTTVTVIPVLSTLSNPSITELINHALANIGASFFGCIRRHGTHELADWPRRPGACTSARHGVWPAFGSAVQAIGWRVQQPGHVTALVAERARRAVGDGNEMVRPADVIRPVQCEGDLGCVAGNDGLAVRSCRRWPTPSIRGTGGWHQAR